ncbi:YbgA family protein [Bhargavaea massiliensis]|uniref:YbgA family protein n=1 Tax=Bhargavaea massiliensis TaxID=2697500 RepID=UPI001BCD3ECB|nr:YbgA family protein [Bhargavaea massiliensis]
MNKRRQMEDLWSREKYRVMYHSQVHYGRIRETLKGNPTFADIESLIGEAVRTPPTPGSVRNAVQHMWGYFKKQADESERQEYRILLERFSSGSAREEELLSFIRRLAEKYRAGYLLGSTILESPQ